MIIAQELIHKMSLKKGKVGYMAIKIDLEKTYDKLEWHFIKDILELYRLPPPLIKLIMSCVLSSSISILLSGGKLEPFHPSRGIRQGDPLSLYLFIMCMEILGFLISEKCEEKLWTRWESREVGLPSRTFSLPTTLFFLQKPIWRTAQVCERP